jgi:hypothetical protein
VRSRTLSRCSTVAATVLSATLLPLSAAHAADASAPTATPTTVDSFGRIADAVLTDRTAALLDRPQLARTARKPQGNAQLSPTLSRTESTNLASVQGTRARLAVLGEAYSDADTKTTVDSTRVEGRRATVRVTETGSGADLVTLPVSVVVVIMARVFFAEFRGVVPSSGWCRGGAGRAGCGRGGHDACAGPFCGCGLSALR